MAVEEGRLREPLTPSVLARAIYNGWRLKARESTIIFPINFEDARKTAEMMLNFFDWEDRIIDNILEQEDRNTFYILEDLGILMTEREEITLYDGREWRIHYWVINKERVYELAEMETLPERRSKKVNVYEELFSELEVF